MRKTLTAGLTALSLILVPAAPAQAEDNTALNQAILGLLAVGAIGLAINKSRDTSNSSVTVHQTPRHNSRNDERRADQAHQPRQQTRQSRHTRRADPLPSRCFRQIELNNGRTQQVFTSRCLDRRYRDATTLPRQCLTRLGGRTGSRQGYEAACLRDLGYRSDRRW